MAKIEHEKVSPLLIDENGEKILFSYYCSRWATTSKTTRTEDENRAIAHGDILTYHGISLSVLTTEA